jgi:hypothetical protein
MEHYSQLGRVNGSSLEKMAKESQVYCCNIRYREKMEERKSLFHTIRADYTKAAAAAREPDWRG